MKKHDEWKRSLAKAVSWRVVAYVVTLYIITTSMRLIGIGVACGLLFADITKIILYILHERMWQKIEWGTKMKRNGICLWFTGLSGAGKTTICKEVERIIKEDYPNSFIERLDGDTLREGICKDLGFSKEDRAKNLDRASYLADVLSKNGVIVLCAFISPFKDAREKTINGIHNCKEVYISSSLELCEERDVKGLYKKARAGEIPNFTGISQPYEAPENADLVIDTKDKTVNQCAQIIIGYLLEYL